MPQTQEQTQENFIICTPTIRFFCISPRRTKLYGAASASPISTAELSTGAACSRRGQSPKGGLALVHSAVHRGRELCFKFLQVSEGFHCFYDDSDLTLYYSYPEIRGRSLYIIHKLQSILYECERLV